MLYGFWLKKVIIPILLVVPILCFVIPLITIGTDNLRMLQHFDSEEAHIVIYAGKIYSRIFIPPEEICAYPQFFYYLAGIVLFPLAWLKGIDCQTIAIVWHGLNAFSGIFTAIFIYFFCLRFFKSVWKGILSSLLFSTTAGYLCWFVNSRPHPLEIFLILVALYFSLRMVEKYNYKLFLGAMIFSGLATATKFGGLFVIPVIWLACLYGFMQLPPSNLVIYLKRKFKLIYIISFLNVIFSVTLPLIVILLYQKFQIKFYKIGINNLDNFLHWRNFRLMLLASGLLLTGSIFCCAINFISHKFANRLNVKNKFISVVNISILYLVYIILGNLLIFLVFNPGYFLFPIQTIKLFGLQIAKSTMGTGLDPGLVRPVFDKDGLIWFKMLFENPMFNKCLAILLIIYLIYEVLFFKRNWFYARQALFQRLLLLSYGLILWFFLILFVFHRPHHYLLPVGMVLSILSVFGALEIFKITKINLLGGLYALFLCLVLFFSFQIKLEYILKFRDFKKGQTIAGDTGLVIGRWLEDQYDSSAKIWKDCDDFYIPLKFKNLYFMQLHDSIENNFAKIKEIEPDVLVITSAYDPSLKNAHKVAQAIKDGKLDGYRLEKEFNYTGPLENFGWYKKIFIYTRNK